MSINHCTQNVNGKPVTFYPSPLEGPDFPWVDIRELAVALDLPFTDDELIRHAQGFPGSKNGVRSISNGPRIVIIVSHPMGQGLAGYADVSRGFQGDDEDHHGPMHWKYCVAAGLSWSELGDFTLNQVFEAFKRHQEGGSL